MDPAALGDVCRRHSVALLVQFGSTVSGVVHEPSDVDIAALLDGDPALRDARIDLYLELARLLPGREVDLAILNTADPLFLHRIVEHGRLADDTREHFLGSPINVAAGERYLERAIGRMIDINFRLITETGHPPPPDYYQSFVELGTHTILETTFARQIASAAGLRNRIAYEYEEIDESKVYDGLLSAIRDIPIYLRQVNAWLERHVGGPS